MPSETQSAKSPIQRLWESIGVGTVTALLTAVLAALPLWAIPVIETTLKARGAAIGMCSILTLLIMTSGYAFHVRWRFRQLEKQLEDPLIIHPNFRNFFYSEKQKAFFCPSCYAKGIRAMIVCVAPTGKYCCVNCSYPVSVETQIRALPN